MEQIAKTITVYISHGLEIIAAVVIAAALLRLIIAYFQSTVKMRTALSAMKVRIQFGSAVAVAL